MMIWEIWSASTGNGNSLYLWIWNYQTIKWYYQQHGNWVFLAHSKKKFLVVVTGVYLLEWIHLTLQRSNYSGLNSLLRHTFARKTESVQFYCIFINLCTCQFSIVTEFGVWRQEIRPNYKILKSHKNINYHAILCFYEVVKEFLLSEKMVLHPLRYQ